MKYNFKSRRKFFFIIPFILLFAISGIVMLLWNNILPDVLTVNKIDYWQAMGILILSKILFGGFSDCKPKKGAIAKKHFAQKIKNMSPEEREKFKQMWKERCKHNRWYNS